MALDPDFKIKVRHFIKDHYKIVLLAIIIFVILILINRYLINKRQFSTPPTTYKPNIAIIDSQKSSVPQKVAKNFEDFIKDYVGYCNNRNYVAAWNLISNDCKKNYFENNYDSYVEYVKKKFDGNTKRYAIQDYSNINDKYIYSVKIFDDFLATGLTNQNYVFQEEKITVSYDENKNVVFSVGNYVDSQKLNYMASNDYLRVEITEAIEKYSNIIYTFNFINRTNNTIVIQDGLAEDWEVGLAIGNEIRKTLDDTKIILEPGQKQKVLLSFDKFYDSPNNPQSIILNTVRIMENYTGNEETAENEIKNAIDKFSMTIAL